MTDETTVATAHLYDAFGNLAAEYASGTVPAPPCYTCYISDDALGNTRMVTDQMGAVQASHDYYPFGTEVASQTAGRNNAWGTTDYLSQKFTGQERDTESGLDHFPARHFASAMGRFMVPDPAGNLVADFTNPQSWNLYSYALNNPLTFVDPTGMACVYAGADNGTWQDYEDPTNYIDDNNGGQTCAQAFASPPQQVTVTDTNSSTDDGCSWCGGPGSGDFFNLPTPPCSGPFCNGPPSFPSLPSSPILDKYRKFVNNACINQFNNSFGGKVVNFFSLTSPLIGPDRLSSAFEDVGGGALKYGAFKGLRAMQYSKGLLAGNSAEVLLAEGSAVLANGAHFLVTDVLAPVAAASTAIQIGAHAYCYAKTD